MRPGSETCCGPAGFLATPIAASCHHPCHEKASRRAKAVVWVRQVIQATTGRPFQLCYSGPTAATSPLFTCSTARPGSPGTSGTTGRVLIPDARHCASGEAHGDGLRPVRRADQATLGDKTSPRVAPACCRLPGDGCSVLLDEPQGAIAMHHHPTVIGRGPVVAWITCRTQTTALARLEAFSWQGWSHDAAIRVARKPAGPQQASLPGRSDLVQRRHSEGLAERGPVRQRMESLCRTGPRSARPSE